MDFPFQKQSVLLKIPKFFFFLIPFKSMFSSERQGKKKITVNSLALIANISLPISTALDQNAINKYIKISISFLSLLTFFFFLKKLQSVCYSHPKGCAELRRGFCRFSRTEELFVSVVSALHPPGNANSRCRRTTSSSCPCPAAAGEHHAGEPAPEAPPGPRREGKSL